MIMIISIKIRISNQTNRDRTRKEIQCNQNNYGRLLGTGRVSRRNAKSGMGAASLISYFFAVVLFTMPHKNAEYS